MIHHLKKIDMKPMAPSKLVWTLGLVLGIVGIIGNFAKVDMLFAYSYWFLLAGFVILAVGTTFREFRV